jgi:hypothetical protein
MPSCRVAPSALHTILLAIMWSVWKFRNSMVFYGDLLSTARIISLIVEHLRMWVVLVHAPLQVDQSNVMVRACVE